MGKIKALGEKLAKDKLVLTLVIIGVVVVIGGAGLLLMGGGVSGSLPEASAKTEVVSPLTGQVYSEELPPRPMVVSIDNVGDAVPQSWLSKADLVYEFPVEGKQTRLQAIYYGEFPEEFGPIRSTRPYFIDLTREYKGIFLAHGWSPEAGQYLRTGVIPYINASNSSLDFYRVDDKVAPHNSYIKWAEVKGEIDRQGWWDEKQDIRPFSFLSAAQVNTGDAVSYVSFRYAGAACEFTYDAATGKFTRTTGGDRYVDHETGEDIKVSNVLVQCVSSSVLDNKGRLRIDMCAGGEAYLFTNGVMVKGTWSREDLDSRTVFVDAEGNEFKLTPGNTWVEIMDQYCTFKYK